ncbi:MAG: helix-turn-helix domain-containing protein [Desulfobacterales bacterium]|nr:helix-turn-helix domain-containing protein [Deltaproteobacteria bacterium]NNL43056.1 helix-turn-helix domain-containing protein [Desulfobacterales bacterium]
MDRDKFLNLRKKLNKTQKEIAQLFGVSVRAVRSYEQGRRNVPPHIERQLYFLISRKTGFNQKQKMCWEIKKCPDSKKIKCPAWEFNAGELCWFISGTICEGTIHTDWKEKMKICRTCTVFTTMMGTDGDE